MPDRPTLEGVLNQIGDQWSRELDSCKVGRLVGDWDRTNSTGTIQPVVTTPAPEGETSGTELPVIPGCPVIFPGVRWDLQIGEAGLLLVCDEAFQRWWRTGEGVATPEGVASHDLGNSIFLPGLAAEPDSPIITANSRILDKPVAGGYVRLGVHNATKFVVHEDALGDILTWAAAVSAAITGLGGDVTGALATLTANLPTRVSPSVTVED